MAAGECSTVAVALAEATAVADGDGAGSLGIWANAVQTSAIELRQVKIVVFISILWE